MCDGGAHIKWGQMWLFKNIKKNNYIRGIRVLLLRGQM
jgi:hypothetical protein